MKPLRECRQSLAEELLRRPADAGFRDDPLRPLLASMLAGRSLREGIMPATLGLSPDDFEALWQAYFPGPHLRLANGRTEEIPELDDLIRLFTDYRAGPDERYRWMALILACGCAGRDHLWQDMAFANRDELSAFMTAAFPALAALNTGDMKWKKFIYRHYCQRDGIYVCPAPSCAECVDYAKCFSPEE